MNVEEVRAAQRRAASMLDTAGIMLTASEREKIEVADFGLGLLETIGLQLVTYVNTARCCAKELVLFPGQLCPEHRHPPMGALPGKEETFRCRAGEVYLYVPGTPTALPKGKIPQKYAHAFTVWHEIVLHPGEQYTIAPDTLHWFQAGPGGGAIISEFSTRSVDEADIFTDPAIARLPVVEGGSALPTLVQFGAGNIGRSFIAPLFMAGGYEVIFIDANAELVQLLNVHGQYRVRMLADEGSTDITLNHVQALHSEQVSQIVERLAEADLAATAVGANALRYLFPVIAQGLQLRYQRHGLRPLDIILAENLRYAAQSVQEGVRGELPADFPLDAMLGLVETSIGKMAVLLTDAQRAEDPLLVCAEPYHTLIVDATAFKNAVPDIPDLFATPAMPAYVERKLFIHNLGHAAVAYLGYQYDPTLSYIWEAVRVPEVRHLAEQAMREAARALLRAYPAVFTEESLDSHIADLLQRFANRALGDTIYRVGRDLPRKLAHDDRLIGAMRLCQAYACPCTAIATVAATALRFRATDPAGQQWPADQELLQAVVTRGVAEMLPVITGLDASDDIEGATLKAVLVAYYNARQVSVSLDALS